MKDRIPPFPTPDALRFLEDQLGSPAWKVFANISEKPVAAASLGQVYRGKCYKKYYASCLILDSQILFLSMNLVNSETRTVVVMDIRFRILYIQFAD